MMRVFLFVLDQNWEQCYNRNKSENKTAEFAKTLHSAGLLQNKLTSIAHDVILESCLGNG